MGVDRFKNALCYVPLVAFILFFTENHKSTEFLKHIKYGVILFVAYAVIYIVFGFMFLWAFRGILGLLYLGISGYLFYKAYNGQDIKLEYIDKAEKKVKENMK
jgi:hypothetical protein